MPTVRDARRRTRVGAALFLVALLTGPGLAAPPDDPQDRLATRDCSKAGNPTLCAQRQRVQRACATLKAADRPACRERLMPVPNCNRALDRRACAQHLMAHEVCRGHEGASFIDCMKVSPGAAAAR